MKYIILWTKSHSRMYLKLKLDSSNIYCGGVYLVYNGLIDDRSKISLQNLPNLCSGW